MTPQTGFTVGNTTSTTPPVKSRQKLVIAEAKARAGRSLLFVKALGLAAVAAIVGTFAVADTYPDAVTKNGIGALVSCFGPAAYALGITTPRLVNYIPGIQGVTSGGIATVNVPVDRRYHTMRILTTNAAGTLTDPTTIVSLVELVVNGIVIRSWAPATYINLAKTYRYTPGTGEIPIFFTEFWRNQNPRSAEATSWDMFGQQTFVVRLTFLSPGGGVGIQSIVADYDLKRNTRRDPATGKDVPFLAIVKCSDISIVAASGTNDVTTIPVNWPIQRIFTDVSANAISSVQIYGDNNVKVWEATKTENQYLLNANALTGTFFEYPVPFDYDDRLESNLKTSTIDFRLVTTGALTATFHLCQLVPGYK